MAGKDFCRLFDKRGMTRHEAKPQHVSVYTGRKFGLLKQKKLASKMNFVPSQGGTEPRNRTGFFRRQIDKFN
jgi:hypothetical protein